MWRYGAWVCESMGDGNVEVWSLGVLKYGRMGMWRYGAWVCEIMGDGNVEVWSLGV